MFHPREHRFSPEVSCFPARAKTGIKREREDSFCSANPSLYTLTRSSPRGWFVVQSDCLKSGFFSIPLPVSHLGLDFLSGVEKTTAGESEHEKREAAGAPRHLFIHRHHSTIVPNRTTVRCGVPAQRLLKPRKALSLRRRANKRV